MNYSKLYANGGFKYSRSQWLPYMRKLPVKGNVLDAPCGDGFWGKILEELGCTVTMTDLNEVGCSKCNGIVHNLEVFNPDWVDQFDWVFSRGLHHLHFPDLTKATEVCNHLLEYGKQVYIIYWTNQTNTDPKGYHYNHTKEALDQALPIHTSKVVNNYYEAILR